MHDSRKRHTGDPRGKICFTCKIVKPTDHAIKGKWNCPECLGSGRCGESDEAAARRKENARVYREQNREKLRVSGRQYRKQNPNKDAEYYAKNSEDKKRKSKLYYESNREAIRLKRAENTDPRHRMPPDYYRRYYAKNRDRVIENNRRRKDRDHERIAERDRKYRLENREKKQERSRRYYAENRATLTGDARRIRYILQGEGVASMRSLEAPMRLIAVPVCFVCSRDEHGRDRPFRLCNDASFRNQTIGSGKPVWLCRPCLKDVVIKEIGLKKEKAAVWAKIKSLSSRLKETRKRIDGLPS